MTNVLIKRENLDAVTDTREGRMPHDHDAGFEVMHLQTKEHQILLANHQKQGEGD